MAGERVSELRINGEALARPNGARLRPSRWRFGGEGADWLELTQGPGGSPAPALRLGDAVELILEPDSASPSAGFRGRVEFWETRPGPRGVWTRYRCVGRAAELDRIPIVSPATGSEGYRFNLPSDDPWRLDGYSGLTVGGMLTRVFEDHAEAMAGAGVGISMLAGDAAGLDWTPPEPVTIRGERLWNAMEQALARLAPNHRLRLEETASGTEVRLLDWTSAPGSDRVSDLVQGEGGVEGFEARASVEDRATRAEAIGGEEVEPFLLRLSDGSLIPDWTIGEEEAWSIADFEEPGSAWDEGTVEAMSPGAVTVRSDDGGREWPTNYWAGARRGRLRLTADVIDLPGQGLETQRTRAVASNTALEALGTSVVTVEGAFDATWYSRYALYGLKEDSERPHVHRRYRPADAGVAAGLRRLFARPEPYRFAGGSALLMTRAPVGSVLAGGTRYPAAVEIDPVAGTVTFAEPVVAIGGLNDAEALEEGGPDLAAPDDVEVFAPVATGRLRATVPADEVEGNPTHGGTAFEDQGLERTRTILLPEWRDRGDVSAVEGMLSDRWRAWRDTRISVRATLRGVSPRDWTGIDRGARLFAGGDGSELGWWGGRPLRLTGGVYDWNGPDGEGPRLSLEFGNWGFPDRAPDGSRFAEEGGEAVWEFAARRFEDAAFRRLGACGGWRWRRARRAGRRRGAGGFRGFEGSGRALGVGVRSADPVWEAEAWVSGREAGAGGGFEVGEGDAERAVRTTAGVDGFRGWGRGRRRRRPRPRRSRTMNRRMEGGGDVERLGGSVAGGGASVG